jgi:succinoglycan biosynthesis protein ExoM
MTDRVCIAVPTYRRKDNLFALLQGLARLDIDPGLTVEVVVLDNDAARSAEETVLALRATYPLELHYESVPEPGLSTVRNSSLAWAYPRADYLAMIDDDEIPEPQWLHELLRVANETGADAVVGPTPAILPDEAPHWYHAWRCSEMRDHSDGSSMSDGWSGNCLLRLSRMRAFDVSFDPSMNFSGGEDTLFFRQVLARGGTIAYAAHATAWEMMPADRMSFGFAVGRNFRKGSTLSICDRRIDGSAGIVAVRVAKACGLAVIGSIMAVASAIRRRNADLVRAACDVARGVGMIAGLFGVSNQPYRRQTP